MVDVPEREFFSHYLAALLKRKDAIKILSYIQGNQQYQPSNAEPESQKEGPKSPKSADWIISVREKVEHAKKEDVARTRQKVCIYKVPKYIKDRENKAYTPKLVSLGPYHHGKKRLRNMESHKWRAFCQILKRCKKDAKVFLDSIKEVEGKARECYEGKISMKSNEFVEMMVLDGCFILELFQGAADGFIKLGYSKNDPVFTKRGSMHLIQRDMIMLENQIPLFVLHRLLHLQFSEADQKKGVEDLAPPFFDTLMPNNMKVFDPLINKLHCLHLFKGSLLSKRYVEPRKRTQSGFRPIRIHCVTELKEAGVKFKKRENKSFWDIKFKKGVLEIPPLLIHDGTKSLFLNLIAFEQSHLDCGSEITSYVIFMDNLINSQEDVGYLHSKGIFEHWLGSDVDVADLFNQLCQEVFYNDDSYLYDLSEKVDQFYNQRWNKWKASLRHKYFNNPWAIVSFGAAVILLILTFLQAFFGIYGYYKPRS